MDDIVREYKLTNVKTNEKCPLCKKTLFCKRLPNEIFSDKDLIESLLYNCDCGYAKTFISCENEIKTVQFKNEYDKIKEIKFKFEDDGIYLN